MIVIADDLTGANDTGVQFVNQGRETLVHLGLSEELVMAEDKVNVINTDSRSLIAEEAYKRNRETAKKINSNTQSLIYKKIDSTLRGNLGREIDGLMDELSFSYCAFAPAYPQNARQTIGGYHLVHGILLEDSELANDVKFPMTQSHIPTLLAEQTSRKVGLVDIRTIREGNITEKVKQLKVDGVEIVVFDAATDGDMRKVSQFLEKEEDVLWVGSAGLAQALTPRNEEAKVLSQKMETSELPTLTIAGSVSSISRRQIDYQKEKGAQVIALHPVNLLNDDANLKSSLEEAKKFITNDKKDVVITTLLSDEIATDIEKYASKFQLDKLEIGNEIAKKIGLFASELIKSVEVSGLILTGGDIAYQTCLHLDIHSLEVIQEVEEGIPLSQAPSGPLEGIAIVTKAGAFGNPASLYNAIKVIRRR